jgi:hypothetical protein
MANRKPEQDLIDSFISALQEQDEDKFKIRSLINKNCKSKKYADVEFITLSRTHWVIEAKSNDSSDAHNTAHKIFGELLKETGKENRNNCKFGILIPEEAKKFYSKKFQGISKSKFSGFGKLIPIETVFSYGHSGIGTMSWEELYNFCKP